MNQNSDVVIGTIGTLVHALVAFLSIYHIYSISKSNNFSVFDASKTTHGRFDSSKLTFFIVLLISSILDIPQYLMCTTYSDDDSPDCRSKHGFTYPFGWSLHYLAMVGYMLCLILMAILWSDVIHQNGDGKFFQTTKFSPIKLYFAVCFGFMILNALIQIFSISINWSPTYTKENQLYIAGRQIEPCLEVLVSIGALYSGFLLQYFVLKFKFQQEELRRFLILMNSILFSLFVSTTLRLFVIFSELQSEREYVGTGVLWFFLTRWSPHVLSMLMLSILMGRSVGGGSNPSSKNSQESKSRAKGSGGTSKDREKDSTCPSLASTSPSEADSFHNTRDPKRSPRAKPLHSSSHSPSPSMTTSISSFEMSTLSSISSISSASRSTNRTQSHSRSNPLSPPLDLESSMAMDTLAFETQWERPGDSERDSQTSHLPKKGAEGRNRDRDRAVDVNGAAVGGSINRGSPPLPPSNDPQPREADSLFFNSSIISSPLFDPSPSRFPSPSTPTLSSPPRPSSFTLSSSTDSLAQRPLSLSLSTFLRRSLSLDPQDPCMEGMEEIEGRGQVQSRSESP